MRKSAREVVNGQGTPLLNACADGEPGVLGAMASDVGMVGCARASTEKETGYQGQANTVVPRG